MSLHLQNIESYSPNNLEEYFNLLEHIANQTNKKRAEHALVKLFDSIQTKLEYEYVRTVTTKIANKVTSSITLEQNNTHDSLEKGYYYKNFRIIGLTDSINEIGSIELSVGGSSFNKFYPDQKELMVSSVPYTNDLEYIPQTIIFENNVVTYKNTDTHMYGYQIPLFPSIGEQTVREFMYYDTRVDIELTEKGVVNELFFEYDLYEAKHEQQDQCIVYQTQYSGTEYLKNGTTTHYNCVFNHPMLSFGVNIYDELSGSKCIYTLKDVVDGIVLKFDSFHVYISNDLLQLFSTEYNNNCIPLVQSHNRLVHDSTLHDSTLYGSTLINSSYYDCIEIEIKTNNTLNDNNNILSVNVNAININVFENPTEHNRIKNINKGMYGVCPVNFLVYTN